VCEFGQSRPGLRRLLRSGRGANFGGFGLDPKDNPRARGGGEPFQSDEGSTQVGPGGRKWLVFLSLDYSWGNH
jgi:hypothetical protein